MKNNTKIFTTTALSFVFLSIHSAAVCFTENISMVPVEHVHTASVHESEYQVYEDYAPSSDEEYSFEEGHEADQEFYEAEGEYVGDGTGELEYDELLEESPYDEEPSEKYSDSPDEYYSEQYGEGEDESYAVEDNMIGEDAYHEEEYELEEGQEETSHSYEFEGQGVGEQ